MENDSIKLEQYQKIEKLHDETRQWKSALLFMDDEYRFLGNLLHSYHFEPDTPKLFERLQNYQELMEAIRIKKSNIKIQIFKHECDLGGMVECTDTPCDLAFYQKHEEVKAEVQNCLNDFQKLKSEIFAYADVLMKKRKKSRPNLKILVHDFPHLHICS